MDDLWGLILLIIKFIRHTIMKDIDKLHYVITCKHIGNAHQFVISKKNFEEAEQSYHTLQLSVFAEEKFDAIARNFLEFESDMLTSVLETSHVGFGEGMEQMAIRRLLNRRMTNVLTATKSYIDHMHHAAKTLFNKDQRYYEVSHRFSYHYDTSFAYRVFEALRNYSQHCGFPIHSVGYSTRVLHHRVGAPMKCTVSPMLDVGILKSDGKFSAKVLKEIEALGNQISLKSLAREYVACLAEVHDLFRGYVGEVSIPADQFLKKMVKLYVEDLSLTERPLGLYAVSLKGHLWANSIPLTTGLWEYGDFLLNTNRRFQLVGKFIVSGDEAKTD